MSRDDNDQIRPRLGRPKASGGGRSRTLVGELLARGVNLRSVTAKRSPSASRKSAAFHRGLVAMRVSVRAPGPRSRRVTVKTRIVNLRQTGARSITTHLRYIERDGVTADGSPGHAYGANLDVVDTSEFAPRARDFTNRRDRWNGRVDEKIKAANRTKSQVRAKVEHVFGVIKRVFGFQKVCYRGLDKNRHRLEVMAALTNLFLVRRRLLNG